MGPGYRFQEPHQKDKIFVPCATSVPQTCFSEMKMIHKGDGDAIQETLV